MFSLSLLIHTLDLSHLLSLILCLLTLRPIMHLGVIDHPVQRSSHQKPTPKGGGLAIIIAFLGGMILHTLLTDRYFSISELYLMGGTFLLCVISWLDDMYSFHARYKLSAQCAATLITALGFNPSISIMIVTLPIGLLFTNAINFMDGLNGLASGAMILTALIMAGFGITPTALLLLAISLLGFLPFNIPKAYIFMGDAGSQPCALILSWAEISLLSSSYNESSHSFSHLLWLLPCLTSGMLWDVLFTLTRRLCAGDSLATAHKGHLYQLAVRTHISALYITFYHWLSVIWGGMSFALFSTPNCFIVALLPQAIWTIIIVQRAHNQLKEKW